MLMHPFFFVYYLIKHKHHRNWENKTKGEFSPPHISSLRYLTNLINKHKKKRMYQQLTHSL